MGKTPSSSSTAAWWWWRSAELQQGFAKHYERRGGREVGLRLGRERLVSWAATKPPIYRGSGGAAPAPRVPSLGVAVTPRSHLRWRPQGEEGEAHLGWALGPICPRVCPLRLLEAPWALVGGAPAHLGAGPFPLLAHESLRGWWHLPVDPRNPSGGPGTLPVTAKILPMAKTSLPIYYSLPPDHSETPRDVRDLIRDSKQHPVTTHNLPYNPSVIEP